MPVAISITALQISLFLVFTKEIHECTTQFNPISSTNIVIIDSAEQITNIAAQIKIMAKRGIEPSGFHGSALSNDHLNNDNPLASNRSRSRSSLSSSWERYLACIAITSLCLIQFGTSVKYLTTTTADTLYSQIMNLTSVQSETITTGDV